MLLPVSPACLLVAVQEVFGPAHLQSRRATRCLPSSQMCVPRALAKFAPRKLSVGDWYRDGTGVGFCGATTEVICTPSFEIELKLWRPQKRKLFVGRLTRLLPLTRPPACPSMSLGTRRLHSAKRHSKAASDTDALQSDKYA